MAGVPLTDEFSCVFRRFLLRARFGYEMIRIMKRVGKISRYLGQSWMTAVWVFLGAYFAFHAFQGDNSLGALKALERQQIALEAEATKVAHQREVLEARTAKLSGKTIDPDMLEEQVRLRLGFVHPDEVVVLVGNRS